MSGLFVTSIANAWHQILSLEFPSHSVINTLWFPPVGLKKHKDYSTKQINKERNKEKSINSNFPLNSSFEHRTGWKICNAKDPCLDLKCTLPPQEMFGKHMQKLKSKMLIAFIQIWFHLLPLLS